VVGGLTTTYSETIRPALQIVGTAPGVSHICGLYMMVLPDGSLKFFSDPTINIAPDAETLAQVAIETADVVRTFDIVPRVAMISFSSFGSSDHPEARKVAQAVEQVRKRRPDLEIEGEMMADVAVDYERQKAEFPFTRLTDAANVLVFPDLSAANVAYKLMMSLGGATAVGPMIVGMNKPVAVLPRDATVDAIVNMTAYTVVQAQQTAAKHK
jgi:malate dehydrogenase (oxaloacetate-decarboxylating)(NADP+)